MQIAQLRARNAALDHRLFDYHALLKASEALHDELDVESLCEVILAMFRERLSATRGAVLLHNDTRHELQTMLVYGLDDPAAEEVRVPLEEGILWRLLLAAEPVAIVDSSGKPRFPDLFGDHGVDRLGASVWVPLVTKSALIGVVAVGGLPDGPLEGERREADVAFLTALAAQAAIAVSTARLYSEVLVARRDLDRSLHNLSMLFDVARALAAVTDLSKLLQLILRRAADAVGAGKGSLMLREEGSDELVVRVVHGLPDPEIARHIEAGETECSRFGRGEGVAGRVFDTGEAIRVDDVENDDGFARRSGSYVRSLICLPLKLDDEVIGVLNVTNPMDGRPFTDDDLDLLEAMASQAAIAIARMRLYELAIRDDLTGLLLRRFIMDRLRQELRRAERYSDDLTVLMADVDHFKSVNDTHGHAVGDAVLVAVADTLVDELRLNVDLPARWGGEEFLVVLPQTSEVGARIAAERLRKRIEDTPIRIPPPDDVGEPDTVHVTVSIGLASSGTATRPSEHTAEGIIKRADDAMYAAKRAGRNRVVLWTELSPTPPATAAQVTDDDRGAASPFDTVREYPLPVLDSSQTLPRLPSVDPDLE